MTSAKERRIARQRDQLRELHRTILDVISAINIPMHDEALLKEAGVTIDRALFRLLVGIERFGPIGVVDLAGRAGRDYTTVSRQVAKLETLGLVKRRDSSNDHRVREAAITPKGKAITDRLDAARERIGRVVLETWDTAEVDELIRLMRKLVDSVNA